MRCFSSQTQNVPVRSCPSGLKREEWRLYRQVAPDGLARSARFPCSIAAHLFLLLLFFRLTVRADIIVGAPVFHSSIKAAFEAAASDQGLVLIVFASSSSESSADF